MIDRVIVQPSVHHIVIRPSIDDAEQQSERASVTVHEGLQLVQVGLVGPAGAVGPQGSPGPQGEEGPQGPQGPAGSGDLSYTHNQIAASTTWTINHNLNKFPAISVVDSGGNVVAGDYQYVDPNTIVLNFTVAFSGKAYLN